MLREEEIKWYQRAKTKGLLEGDSNTKYFNLVANGKHSCRRFETGGPSGRRVSAACPSPDGSSAWASTKGGEERGGRSPA
jgi:hypothetical protein